MVTGRSFGLREQDNGNNNFTWELTAGLDGGKAKVRQVKRLDGKLFDDWGLRHAEFGFHGDGTLSTAQLGDGNTKSTWTLWAQARVALPIAKKLVGPYEDAALWLGPRAGVAGRVEVLDIDGRPLVVKNPDDGKYQYARNGRGLVTQQTDPLGRVTKYKYDAADLRKIEYPQNGEKEEFTYRLIITPLSKFTVLESHTDERQNKEEYDYDAIGNRTWVKDREERKTYYEYGSGNLAGLVTKVIDARGTQGGNTFATKYQYDSARRLANTMDALEYSTVFNYDVRGNLTETTDARENKTHFKYDAFNRMTWQEDALKHETKWRYDHSGLLTQTIDALNRQTVHLYDNRGWQTIQVEAVSTPTQRLTMFTYDLAGNVSELVEEIDRVEFYGIEIPILRKSSYNYDDMNRRTRQVEAYNQDSLKRITLWKYNQVGNLVYTLTPFEYGEITYAAGHQDDPEYAKSHLLTSYGYDNRDRLIAMIESTNKAETNSLSRSTTTQYYPNGLISRVTDPETRKVEYEYDKVGRQTEAVEYGTTGPRRRSVQVYDVVGNLTLSTDPMQVQTGFKYDAVNRLRTKTVAKGDKRFEAETIYTYDPVGNLVEVDSPRAYKEDSNKWWNAADPRRQLTRYEYDEINRRTVVTQAANGSEGLNHPSPRTSTVYDAVGNVIDVIDPLQRVTHFEYDALYRQTAVLENYLLVGILGTVVPLYSRSTKTEYDLEGNVLAITRASGNDGVFASRSVTDRFNYDLLGRQTQAVIAAEASGSEDFTALKITTQSRYDAADRLTLATDPRGTKTAFAYDGLGRRTKVTEAVGINGLERSSTMQYDKVDRLILKVTPKVYDNFAGTATNEDRVRTSYSYDGLGRLTRVVEAELAKAQRTTVNEYDLADRLTMTAIADLSRTRFRYDPLGRQTAVVEAADYEMQRTTFRHYDAAGNLRIESRDKNYDLGYQIVFGDDPKIDDGIQTHYGYDALNRRVSQTQAANAGALLPHKPPTTQYRYDAAGRLVETRGPVLASLNPAVPAEKWMSVTRNEYDGLDHVTKVIEGTLATTTGAQPVWLRESYLSYDSDGRVLSQTTPVAYLGDQADMIETMSAVGAASHTTYAYDAAGRRIAMSEGLSVLGPQPESRWTQWQYDDASNVIRERRGGYRNGKPFGLELSYDSFAAVSDSKHDYDALNRRVKTVAAFAPEGWAVPPSPQILGPISWRQHNRSLLGHDSPVTQFHYDAANNLTGVVNPRGVGSSYSYDALGRQTLAIEGATVPQGWQSAQSRTEKRYDTLGRLTAVINPNKAESRIEFDKLSRQTKSTEAVGQKEYRETSSGYDAQDNMTTQTRGAGGTGAHPIRTDYRYDALNRRTKVIALANLTDEQIKGHLKHERPVTNYRYDARNLLIETTDRIGGVDLPNNETIAGADRRSVFSYDVFGRQTKSIEAASHPNESRTQEAGYDLAGNLQWSLDGRGVKTTYTFDRLRRQQSSSQDPLTNDKPVLETRLTYDSFDKVVARKTPLGTTTYEYDRLGRQRYLREPNGHEVLFTYDASNNQLSLLDKGGRAKDAQNQVRPSKTEYAYDALDRRTMEIDARGLASAIIYDDPHRRVILIDREGEAIERSYDYLGRLTKEELYEDPGIESTPFYRKEFEYNLLDQLTVSSVPVNKYQPYVTQKLVDLVAEPNKDRARILRHDKAYDILGRLSKETDYEGSTVTLHYDTASRRVAQSDSWNGLTISRYDAAGRLKERELRKGSGTSPVTGVVVQWEYDKNRRDLIDTVKKMSSSGGLTERYYGYDGLARLYSFGVNHLGTTTEVDNVHTVYNQQGLVFSVRRAPAETEWGYTVITKYDEAGQATSEQVKDPEGNLQPAVTYSYDAQGNSDAEGSVYNLGNQLAQDKRAKYSYDHNGNLTEEMITDDKVKKEKLNTGEAWWWEYRYNHLGQIIRSDIRAEKKETIGAGETIPTIVHTTTDKEVRFLYDAEGRLIFRHEEGTQTVKRTYLWTTTSTVALAPRARSYSYQGQDVWGEWETGGKYRRYLRGDGVDQLLGTQVGTATGVQTHYWYVTDTQGSVLRIVSADGKESDKVAYFRGSSGTILKKTQIGDRIDSAGRDIDEATGLRNHRARWYNPRNGRWMSEDPLGFGGGDTNLYRFAGNSWPNATDPSGKTLFGGATLIGASLGAVIGGVVGYVASGGDMDKAAMGIVSGAMVGAGVGLLVDTWGVGALVAAPLIGAGIAGGTYSAYRGGVFNSNPADGLAYFEGLSQGAHAGFMAGSVVAGIAGTAMTLPLNAASWGWRATLMLQAAKAGAGAIHGYGTARLHDPKGDPTLSTLQGGFFGAIDPGFYTLGQTAGSAAGYAITGDKTGWDVGGMVGGFAGGIAHAGFMPVRYQPCIPGQAAQHMSRMGSMAWSAAWDVGGVSAGLSYAWATGQWELALEYAQQGQMVAHWAKAGIEARLRACFVAGTPLEVPGGSKHIEQIQVGDFILSRHEDDPQGEVVPKRVLEVFVRTGRIWTLRVEGRTIGTTGEHPFFCVRLWRWTEVRELVVGDFVLGRDGRFLRVEEVNDTGEYATVYNLHIEDFHTYFVGTAEWGWSVWAHNYDPIENLKTIFKGEHGLERASLTIGKYFHANGTLVKGKTLQGFLNKMASLLGKGGLAKAHAAILQADPEAKLGLLPPATLPEANPSLPKQLIPIKPAKAKERVIEYHIKADVDDALLLDQLAGQVAGFNRMIQGARRGFQDVKARANRIAYDADFREAETARGHAFGRTWADDHGPAPVSSTTGKKHVPLHEPDVGASGLYNGVHRFGDADVNYAIGGGAVKIAEQVAALPTDTNWIRFELIRGH